MELTITLYGSPNNPQVEIGKNVSKANDIYVRSPLMAFLISIPHCIYLITNEINERKGNNFEYKVVARYQLDNLAIFTGNYVFEKIIIEICSKKCKKDYMEELLEIVKNSCPIYLSLKDKMELTYRLESEE
jgi:uncharacterized OsmC-like protein